MLSVNRRDFVRFHVCLSVAPDREDPAQTFADEVKDLLRGVNRTLSRSTEESSRDGKLFCSGCKSGLLSFGASAPATIQRAHIQPNRQAERDKNQETQERQREVTNVYTITRSNLMSLRLVFLARMKSPCLTVGRRTIFGLQGWCRLTGLRVAPSASRQERQRYEVINYGEPFISRNRRRILIQGNGHFCGFALFQLEHVAKGDFWKPGTFANSYPQQW